MKSSIPNYLFRTWTRLFYKKDPNPILICRTNFENGKNAMPTLIAKYIQFSYGALFKSKEFSTCDLYLDPDPKKEY
jgi:hypothetical protein